MEYENFVKFNLNKNKILASPFVLNSNIEILTQLAITNF